MHYIQQVIFDIWNMLTVAAPFILFGFLAAGLIHTFVKAERIVALVGKRSWKSVLIASLCGVPLPLCSCSVLPTAATLREKGASKGATTSFLISTPETGVDSIALTYGMMGGWMAFLRPVSAAITALSAGLAVNALGGDENAEPFEKPKTSCCHSEEPKEDCHKEEAKSECCSGQQKEEPKQECCSSQQKEEPAKKSCCGGSQPKQQAWWQATLHYSFVQLSDNLAKWLAIGFVLSGLIASFIPASLFESWAGQGFTSLVLMLAVSMPFYICASGSTPMAAAMLMKGLSPGAAVVFLLAGPATNLAALPVLYKILGKRSTVIYLASIFVMTLAVGMVINLLFTADYFTLNIGHEHASEYSVWNTVCAAVLALLILKGLCKKIPFVQKLQAVRTT